MAQRIQVLLIDDIDGGEASETVPFSFDGVDYEIDLNAANAAALRDALAMYVGSARKAKGRSVARRRPVTSADVAVVREWAKSSGVKVNERGRVPASVYAAYEAARV